MIDFDMTRLSTVRHEARLSGGFMQLGHSIARQTLV